MKLYIVGFSFLVIMFGLSGCIGLRVEENKCVCLLDKKVYKC